MNFDISVFTSSILDTALHPLCSHAAVHYKYICGFYSEN